MLPTERCRDFFVVDAHINGTGPWRLLLDSGTAVTLLDPDVRRTIAPSGIDSLRIGGFQARHLAVEAQPMEELSNALGLQLDGILGHPVFAAGLVTYDYPRGEVRLSRSRLDAADEGIARTGSGGRPLVTARVGGWVVPVLVDTGSSQGLSFTGLHRFSLAEEPVPTGARVRVDGVHTLRTARLAGTVRLGPLRLDRPLVHESPAMDLVGTRVLRHFAVTFDQRSRRVAFRRPGASVGEPLSPETEWSLGMALQPGPEAHEVVEVFAGSPAARAGIRRGDRVRWPEGTRPGEGRCRSAPVELPPPPPGPVSLTVERDGQTRSVVLEPAPVVGG